MSALSFLRSKTGMAAFGPRPATSSRQTLGVEADIAGPDKTLALFQTRLTRTRKGFFERLCALASYGYVRDLPINGDSIRPDEDFAINCELHRDIR